MANNPNTRPTDVKREEFRKYVERAGVMDALTNLMMKLYQEQEKPEDALDYIRKHFIESDSFDPGLDTSEMEILKKDLAEAKEQIAELKEKLNKYESAEND